MDFERCLQLAGTDLRESELFATLTALWAYYLPRGDLRRTQQLSESMRGRASSHQKLVSPLRTTSPSALSPGMAGISLHARSLLEEATAALAAGGIPDLDTGVVCTQ